MIVVLENITFSVAFSVFSQTKNNYVIQVKISFYKVEFDKNDFKLMKRKSFALVKKL
jgi:hypothetical protein